MQGMDWNKITSTAEALNCIIILLQHTAVPVALDLKGSWASLHLLRYTGVYWTDVKQHFCIMCSRDNVLTWWLHGHQIWGEHRSVNDCCTVGGRAEIILTPTVTGNHWNLHTQANTHSAVTGLWPINSNITWLSAVIQASFPLQWH